ncbi:MAG TPA: hypothetical protein VIM30_14760 [Candidatus Limnocylindrales bacterium]
MITVALVLGTNMVREVVGDLAVTDEQEVIVARQCARDLIEECPHVFVAMPFASRVHFGGRPLFQ